MKTLIMGALLALMFVGVMSCGLIEELDRFVADPQLVTPDLNRIADGTYVGEYESGPIKAKVEVTVTDHRITGCILMEHRTGKGRRAEVIVDSVVKEQSVEVDAISGATYSSKVILKAAQIALERGE